MPMEAIIKKGYAVIPYCWDMIPIKLFSKICPTRAMTNAMLKAVPDNETYLLPMMPSMTGNVDARPAPISAIAVATCINSDEKDKRPNPANTVSKLMNNTFSIFIFLNITTKRSRAAVSPATMQVREINACPVEMDVVCPI